MRCCMSGFFEAMFAEINLRRRRLRAALGNRGQAIVEFLVLAGLMLGSLGLFVRPWMAGVTPWGFALPFVFIAGFFLIEVRRQRAVHAYRQSLPQTNDALDAQEWAKLLAARQERPALFDELAVEEAKFQAKAAERRQARYDNADATIAAAGYDWGVIMWSLACTLLGVAAFVIAFTSAPPSEEEDIWTPPESAVSVDISP